MHMERERYSATKTGLLLRNLALVTVMGIHGK